MRLTLLGTGNAAGMPLYGCDCEYCVAARTNRERQRTPCSALLEVSGQRFLLDGGQVNLTERYPSGTIAGIFLTHFHPDHVQGLFHLRWGVGGKIPVYGPQDEQGCADLYQHPGILEFRPRTQFESFVLGNLTVTPIPLNHSKPTLGYLFECVGERIAYLTDTKGLPPSTEKVLREAQPDLMVIDCSFTPGSDKRGHNNLDDVISIDRCVQPKRTVLTHIGHDFDIWLRQEHNRLPPQIRPGRDGMVAYAPGR